MGFSEDLKLFQQNCEKEANRNLRRITLTAIRKIVRRTPVKTGLARSNWNVSVNTEDTSFDPSKKGKSGAESISLGTPIIEKLVIGSTINMTNACPYIVDLERGHSRQQPCGFLKLSQEEVQKLIDKGAR